MKIKKYQNPDGPIQEGWNEDIIPIVPLTGLSRQQIKRNAIGNARDRDFANEYLNSRIDISGDRK